MNTQTLEYVDIPILQARQLPDPFGKPYVRHVLDVDTRRIPALPNKANARDAEAGINKAVYKAVQNSAMDGKLNPDEQVTSGLFGYKHLGVNVVADRLEKLDDHTSRVFFRDADAALGLPGDGMSNGAHGVELLRRLQARLGEEMPPNFITVTVTTGLPRECTAEIAGANNSGIQVQVSDLANLDGLFEPFKAALNGTKLESKVAWRKDDDGEISVTDLLSTMICFRPDLFPTDGRGAKHPVCAYNNKAVVVQEFRRNPDGFYKLIPILHDILTLTDTVRTTMRDSYNASGGRYGQLAFVDKAPEKRGQAVPFQMPFTGEETEYRLNMSAVYPILAAFRAFVEDEKIGENGKQKIVARWKAGFQSVLATWERTGVQILETAKDACAGSGYSLTVFGKNSNYWTTVQLVVMNDFLRAQMLART